MKRKNQLKIFELVVLTIYRVRKDNYKFDKYFVTSHSCND